MSNFKTSKRALSDNYNINSSNMGSYIHNNPIHFQNIINKNNISSKDLYLELKESANSVIISILDELIKDWEKIRTGIIKKGNEIGLSKETDPESFLKDYNNRFKSSIEGGITQDLFNWKEFKLDYKKIKRKKDNKKEIMNFINKSWDQFLNFLIKALNFYDVQSKIWVTAFTGETEEEFKKRMKLKMPINLIEQEIKKALAPLKIQNLNASLVIKKLKDIKNQVLPITESQKLEIFKNSFDNQFAQAAGKLIEFTSAEEEYTDEILSKLTIEKPDIRKPIGVQLKDVAVGDVLVATLEFDNNKIKVLKSWKLTEKTSVERRYSVTNDILPKLSDALCNKVSWLRQNINAFKANYSNENQEYWSDTLSHYINFEIEIALLLLIPRILDGIYEIQEKITYPSYGSIRVHTALFPIKDEFVWMADILKSLRKLIESNRVGDGITYRKPEISKTPINSQEMDKLYLEKREAIKNLSKQSERIDYVNIAKLIDLNKLNQKFTNWKPISALTTTVKYGSLI